MNKTNLNIRREDNQVIISLTNLGVASKKNTYGGYTVWCPSLKIMGFAKTKAAAFKDFEKNLQIFFDVHVNNDSIERVLLKFKWNRIEFSVLRPIEEQPLYASDNEPFTKPHNIELAIAA